MAIGWFALLTKVPWSEVISNAPKVADAAKKLWKAVANKSVSSETLTDVAPPHFLPDATFIAGMEARLIAMEAGHSDLQNQMLASSELIKELADQNAQLVKRIETNRIRVIWLTVAIGLVIIFMALARLR
ncbi:MAG: hypothetical protein CVU69_01935 [Deltaproteobacteria bacterium HGW-Deltaproteobacteria-4]|nr:MAG: hypothetical protein CVU69_01935 [Deltaproteobacteria bacterium HGW-Deltaproteobacteria-4]